MSVTEVDNVVLLFSNPVWDGGNTVPTTIVRNITALSSDIAYEATISENLTTLTNTDAETLNGVIQGLLYVPDIPTDDPCYEMQYDLIPRNVTRQAQLPPTNYNLIALAPWFNASCTQSYLAAARLDPIRAFIFYRPNNSSAQPQPVSSVVWDLGDNGKWKTENKFPIFAVPGTDGASMMLELSKYSGNLTEVPYGDQIIQLYGPNPKDYVRIWTELTMSDPSSMPAMWMFFVIVIGSVLVLISCISIFMHLVLRQRRILLRRRVMDGEVDLEAMGIKRVTVPASHVQSFPLFTYTSDPEVASIPPTPHSPRSSRSTQNSRRAERAFSDVASHTGKTRRPSVTGSLKTEATNFQPQCHICLEMFENRSTVIRELPCGHIFHPECIDEFLTEISSLCPICKRSMLPLGYSPRITNGMVRRERAVRRIREQVIVIEEDPDWGSEEKSKKDRFRRLFRSRARGSSTQAGVPLRISRTGKEKEEAEQRSSRTPTDGSQASASTSQSSDVSESTSEEVATQRQSQHRRKSSNLQLQPTLREDVPSNLQGDPVMTPTANTRQRMRSLAGSPFDDPYKQQPKWRRAISKVFPGIL